MAVRDHGIGFEASQAKQVFHRFWRADPARARTVGGTGLGLAIAMEDANLHGGWLTAWGRPGLGAQFRLTLPRTAGAWSGDLAVAHGAARPGRPRRDSTRRADRRCRAGRDPRRALRRRRRAEPPSPIGTRRWSPMSRRGRCRGSGDRRCWSRCWAGRLCLRADRRAGRAGRGPAAGVPELRQRRGRAAGARRRPLPDRRGLPAGHLELPARLLHRQAVPDPGGDRELEPGGRGVDLSAASPRSVEGNAVRADGRLVGSLAADRTYKAARSGHSSVTSGWSRRTGSGGSTTRRRD